MIFHNEVSTQTRRSLKPLCGLLTTQCGFASVGSLSLAECAEEREAGQ